MTIGLCILYRGPIRSCNFSCFYCPFQKEPPTREAVAADGASLERFVSWVEASARFRPGVFFTPWGEALTFRHYRRAIVRLSHLHHIRRVAVQTNCSMELDWLQEGRADRIGLWISWHPHSLAMEDLLRRCSRLDELGVRHSVGAVGCRQSLGAIADLRQRLPDTTYLWVNAYREIDPPYSADEVAAIKHIDPLFAFNFRSHPSKGRPCNAGHSVIAVDGNGDIRPCHLQSRIIGSINDPGWSPAPHQPRCTQATCHCHIGYAHRPDLGLDSIFGSGILERIPKRDWKGWGTWLS
jgi:hypothetical protein